MEYLGLGLTKDNEEVLLVICDCGENLSCIPIAGACHCPACGRFQSWREMVEHNRHFETLH